MTKYRKPKDAKHSDTIAPLANWLTASFAATSRWHESLQTCPLCRQAKLVPLHDGTSACCLRACPNFKE